MTNQLDCLQIHVLPTVLMIVENQTKSKLQGFDELGGTDEFPTELLEWRLARGGAIDYQGDLTTPPTVGGASNSQKSVFGFAKKGEKSKTIQNGKTTTESDDDEFDENDWN